MQGRTFQLNDTGAHLSVEPISGGVLEVEATRGFVPEELAPVWVRRWHGELIFEAVSRYAPSPLWLDPSPFPRPTLQMVTELLELGVVVYNGRDITINNKSVHMAFRRDAATDELRTNVLEVIERTWSELQLQPVA